MSHVTIHNKMCLLDLQEDLHIMGKLKATYNDNHTSITVTSRNQSN